MKDAEAAKVCVKICRAFQPGDVVFIECAEPLTAQARADVRAMLESALEGTAVKMVLLDRGLKLATRSEKLHEVDVGPVCRGCEHPIAGHAGGTGECLDVNCSCDGVS